MLKLFYFFKGYLVIRVSGASAERFMNLCGIRHIMLWDIRQDGGTGFALSDRGGGTGFAPIGRGGASDKKLSAQQSCPSYTMCISLKSFFELRDIVHKTSTRVVILKRVGLPFLMPGVRKRWFFPAFLFLVILLFALSQFLLWNIRIIGNQKIDTESIQTFLEGYDIRKGMLKKQIDTELLEKELRKGFMEVTWVSVYLDGNSLVVHLKENDKLIAEEGQEEEKLHKEGFLEEAAGIDICAAKNGTVVSLVMRTGTPMVSPGDTVSTGDVLIRGVVEIFDNDGNVRETVNVHADGDVLIESSIKTVFQTSLQKTVSTETGRSRKYTYIRYGEKYRTFHLFQIPYAHYNAVPHAYFKPEGIPGITFEIGEMEVREELRTETEKPEEEYKAELSGQLQEYIATLEEKAIQIRGKNVKIEKNEDTVTLTGILKVQGPFVERKETELQEELPEAADG